MTERTMQRTTPRTTLSMRVLVADDELLARKRLVRLLAAMEDVRLAGECENGHLVLERIKTKDVDVVLLDIHMPGLSGIETASLLPEDGPVIVLCTAHPDHAVDAFEQGAVDYILKPVEAGRLRKALDRARARLEATGQVERQVGHVDDAAQAQPDARPISRLAVPTREGIVLLDPRTVSHAVLDGELVTIVADAGTYLSDDTLNDLQERLPRDLFERVHRRALLNLEHVVRLEPIDSGGFLAYTRGGHSVEISRQSARELRKRLRVR
jgi:two-component system LytT family response regulator